MDSPTTPIGGFVPPRRAAAAGNWMGLQILGNLARLGDRDLPGSKRLVSRACPQMCMRTGGPIAGHSDRKRCEMPGRGLREVVPRRADTLPRCKVAGLTRLKRRGKLVFKWVRRVRGISDQLR